MPSSWAAATYLAMVSLDKPVPNAILRWLSPACHLSANDLLVFPFWKPPGMPSLNLNCQSAAMIADVAPNVA